MTPDESKRALRERARAWLGTLSETARTNLSQQACAVSRDQKTWRSAGRVLFYVPLRDEIDIAPLLQDALDSGKTVALPKFESEHNGYRARRIENYANDCAPGKFGIHEPGVACSVIPLNQLDFVLVPGVGFSRLGHRLGRGRGYYDRLLAEVSGWKCGVAFDEQLFEDIPREDHDILVDSVLTPSRWISPGDPEGS